MEDCLRCKYKVHIPPSLRQACLVPDVQILSHIARHTLFTSVALRSSCFVRAALQWSCFVRACCPLHYHDVALSAHAGYKDADFQFSDACLAHNCAIHVHQ
eukprot:scaffold162359_cov14-Tisochrysis_lutea.AAC.1